MDASRACLQQNYVLLTGLYGYYGMAEFTQTGNIKRSRRDVSSASSSHFLFCGLTSPIWKHQQLSFTQVNLLRFYFNQPGMLFFASLFNKAEHKEYSGFKTKLSPPSHALPTLSLSLVGREGGEMKQMEERRKGEREGGRMEGKNAQSNLSPFSSWTRFSGPF